MVLYMKNALSRHYQRVSHPIPAPRNHQANYTLAYSTRSISPQSSPTTIMLTFPILSIFNAVMTTTNFRLDDFPKKEIKEFSDIDIYKNTVVRVAVALNGGKGPIEADGPIPTVLAFEENQHYLGASSLWTHRFKKIKSGGHFDVWVQQDQGLGRQATYLQVRGHDDGICVAYVSQLWADSTPRAWLGDMGMACDVRYYYSNIVVGDNDHRPCKRPCCEQVAAIGRLIHEPL